MREISSAHNITANEFLAMLPQEFREIVEGIRHAKRAGIRPLPSSSFIDKSSIADPALRRRLLDKIATLVDENLAGRSEMCAQFSLLLARALTKLGYPSSAVTGEATYFQNGQNVFSWRHSWVRTGNELIDGNVDVLSENPVIPRSIAVQPYWGPPSLTPPDRRLRQDHSARTPEDLDVNNIWWPELEVWINAECLQSW